MMFWKRAALLGFLSWLVPFAVSFLAFPAFAFWAARLVKA